MNGNITNYIGKNVKVEIDRPLGTKHPRFEWHYPINYGFVPNTVSGDGKELDVYVLGIDTPLEAFKGTCIAVIERADDDDPKLVVVPDGMQFSDNEIESAVAFQEQWFDATVRRA